LNFLRGKSKPSTKVSLGAFTTLRSSLRDLTVVSLFVNGLSLALPLLLLQVYDRILPSAGLDTLVLLVVGVLVALMLDAVLRIGRSHITGWIGARFEHVAGCRAFERIVSTNIQDYAREGSGAHLERMTALGTVKDFYAGQVLLTLLDLPFAALFLTLIWYLGGELVLVPLVMLGLFAISAVVVGARLHQALNERLTWDDRRFNFIIEVLNGIHIVKAMAMEAQMMRRYERLLESCSKGDHRAVLSSAAALNVGAFFSEITMVAVVGFGSLLAMDGRLTIGGLAACTLLAGRALQPLQRAMNVWTRFQTIRLARKRVKRIFQAVPEAATGEIADAAEIKGMVELDDVSFRYDADSREIVSGANVRIAAGECIALAGGNGSGRSTLLELMLGVLRPTDGAVRVDGHDISSFDPSALKKQIAYLPEQGEVFKGSIMENITMFDAALTDRAVEIAIELGLDRVVDTMPMGWDTMIGDAAMDSLPPGIKQRIAIARGLVTEPKIILFDEANMAIDSTGDAFLRAALERRKGKCTMVLITYRPSLLKLADRVFECSGGTLVQRPNSAHSAPPPEQPARETRPELEQV